MPRSRRAPQVSSLQSGSAASLSSASLASLACWPPLPSLWEPTLQEPPCTDSLLQTQVTPPLFGKTCRQWPGTVRWTQQRQSPSQPRPTLATSTQASTRVLEEWTAIWVGQQLSSWHAPHRPPSPTSCTSRWSILKSGGVPYSTSLSAWLAPADVGEHMHAQRLWAFSKAHPR